MLLLARRWGYGGYEQQAATTINLRNADPLLSGALQGQARRVEVGRGRVECRAPAFLACTPAATSLASKSPILVSHQHRNGDRQLPYNTN